jgi:hypothetical protein
VARTPSYNRRVSTCRSCRQPFVPERRGGWAQVCCSAPCRLAHRRANQRRRYAAKSGGKVVERRQRLRALELADRAEVREMWQRVLGLAPPLAGPQRADCPRCGGLLTDWYDHDKLCAMCGNVLYATPPPTRYRVSAAR